MLHVRLSLIAVCMLLLPSAKAQPGAPPSQDGRDAVRGAAVSGAPPASLALPRAAGGDRQEQACAARWAAYRQSQACYAQFQTVYGLRGGAAQACGEPLLDPSPDCGLPTLPR
ncbi:hypothetical protein [Ramlibacter tataouinensis]|uniref:Uncharacterized protein n=1 Tax=Ramlibacter tataouinensis (strain ATCC BAA-407 / DSM 14655 / LMG 21543 / TTB310) TaxID=365046 RepID=F5XYH3_RAMTT|nr:hypothetical protein [Ramlibacter tataouinensis]AEG93149.1 hypothetical protein Rta_20560 [Ramlibacter tataouinensis TTB310]